MHKKILIWVAVLLMAMPSAWAADKNIVVSIKPLHSLVQAVLGDSDSAYLIVSAANSPHDFYLRPSQIKALNSAAIVFYISDEFESFLNSALANAPESVQKIAVVDAAQLDLLKMRRGGVWEELVPEQHEQSEHKDHGHGHHHHHAHHAHHAEYDMHVWLDPLRAQTMATAIATALAARFPEHNSLYQANAEQLKNQLQQLHQQLQTTLTAVMDKPYIVFHDAYQYFEKRYSLGAAGAIGVLPTEVFSPQRLQSIKARITETKAQCVFREPQFADNKAVQTIIGGTEMKTGMLDPLGADIEAGPDAYFQLMHALAAGLKSCLM